MPSEVLNLYLFFWTKDVWIGIFLQYNLVAMNYIAQRGSHGLQDKQLIQLNYSETFLHFGFNLVHLSFTSDTFNLQ